MASGQRKAMFIRFDNDPLTVQVLGLLGAGKQHTALLVREVDRPMGATTYMEMVLKFARDEKLAPESALRREVELTRHFRRGTQFAPDYAQNVTVLLEDRTNVPERRDPETDEHTGDLACTMWDLCVAGSLRDVLERCIKERVVFPAAFGARVLRDVLVAIQSVLATQVFGVQHFDLCVSNVFVHLDEDLHPTQAHRFVLKDKMAFPAFVLGDWCDGKEVAATLTSRRRWLAVQEDVKDLRERVLLPITETAARCANPAFPSLQECDAWRSMKLALDRLDGRIESGMHMGDVYAETIRALEDIERQASDRREVNHAPFLDLIHRIRDHNRTELTFASEEELNSFAKDTCDLPEGSSLVGTLKPGVPLEDILAKLRRPGEPEPSSSCTVQ